MAGFLRSHKALAAAALSLGLAAVPLLVQAQAPPPAPPLVGSIDKLEGDVLSVRTPAGVTSKLVLRPATRIVNTVPAKLADVKGNDFIGTTAVEKDGKLVSTEVHVFAEELRGMGEGHYPMGASRTTMTNGAVGGMMKRPTTTMTNGSVSKDAAAGAGRRLTVNYKGGQKVVEVGPEVPVVRLVVADRGALRAGRTVTAFGTPGPGGFAADTVIVADAAAPPR